MHRLIILLRFLFLAAIACLSVGGGFAGNYKSSSLSGTGQKIIKAGYLDFAAIVAIIMGFQVYLWSRKSQLTETSVTVSITYATPERVENLILNAPQDIERNDGCHSIPHRPNHIRPAVRLFRFFVFEVGFSLRLCHHFCIYGSPYGVHCRVYIHLHWTHHLSKR